MQDGTVLLGIHADPGASGYINETDDIWVERFGTGKILDPDRICALLFINKDTLPDGEAAVITEDNCFEVPIR